MNGEEKAQHSNLRSKFYCVVCYLWSWAHSLCYPQFPYLKKQGKLKSIHDGVLRIFKKMRKVKLNRIVLETLYLIKILQKQFFH